MVEIVTQDLRVATDADATRAFMAEEVCRGLAHRPRQVPSKYLYDQQGCDLFDEITRLPEYYLTRTETAILEACGDEIVALTKPESIVELGAGYCTKTPLLLAPALRAGTLRHFVPTDVSPAAIEDVAGRLPADFPGLSVHGVVVEFERAERLPRYGRQLVIFLGSTIGNLDRPARARFLRGIRDMLSDDDSFLLGVDLVKDASTINAAYNDADGVTAAFTRNLLRVLNRELGANFDLGAFKHHAQYHPERHRVEIYLQSLKPQSVHVPACDLRIDFEPDELVRTEISVKFERASLSDELQAAGMRLRGWFTDPAERFALALASPALDAV
jgi:L-histidine Nalpha-methyltransferase